MRIATGVTATANVILYRQILLFGYKAEPNPPKDLPDYGERLLTLTDMISQLRSVYHFHLKGEADCKLKLPVARSDTSLGSKSLCFFRPDPH
jgi:hypothetical protein